MTKAGHIAIQDSASVESILRIAGVESWHPEDIDEHMQAEAAKLRPNVWWHIVQRLEVFGGGRGGLWFFQKMLNVIFAASLITLYAVLVCIFLSPANSFATCLMSALAVIGELCFLYLLGHIATRSVVRSPGRWKTIPVNPKRRVWVPAAEEARQKIASLIPGVKFEISLLYQDEKLLDPVLWAVVPCGQDINTTRRFAVSVWDKDDKIVLSPRAFLQD